MGFFSRRKPSPERQPDWSSKGRFCEPPGHSRQGSPIKEMNIGYHGEIFIKFADGSNTCVWPTGEPVSPSRERAYRIDAALQQGSGR